MLACADRYYHVGQVRVHVVRPRTRNSNHQRRHARFRQGHVSKHCLVRPRAMHPNHPRRHVSFWHVRVSKQMGPWQCQFAPPADPHSTTPTDSTCGTEMCPVMRRWKVSHIHKLFFDYQKTVHILRIFSRARTLWSRQPQRRRLPLRCR